MSKKILLFTFMIIFSFGILANPFSQLNFNDWSYKAIYKLASKGLLTGYPDGSFNKNKDMTRYEAAMIVARILKNLKTDKGRNATSDDHMLCEKLSIEFADELSLIGVKLTTTKDEMSVMKEVIETTKNDANKLKEKKETMLERNRMFSWYGNIKFSSESNFYEKDSTSPIPEGSSNTFNGIALPRRLGQTNEDTTNFKTRLKLFFDANIEDDISGHIQVDNDWANQNKNYDVWGNENDNSFAINVREAYIEIHNFFGWTDKMKFGRQYFGIADGLAMDGEKDELTLDGVERDGLTAYKKFNDTISSDVYLFRTDSKGSTGLNIIGGTLNIDFPEMKSNLKGYYVHRADDKIFDPSAWPGYPHDNGGDYSDITFPSASIPYTAGSNYDLNHDNPSSVDYMGLSLNGNITRDMKYYTEFSTMNFVNSPLEPDDAPTWNESINMQTAYLVGLHWDATDKFKLTTFYRSFDKHYRPISANTDFYDTSRFDKDNIGDTEYENLGYTSDFRDWFLRSKYYMDERTDFTGTYELIDDKRLITGREDDDMYIISFGFNYKYKKKTNFRLYYKYFALSQYDNGEAKLSNMAYDTGTIGTYERGVDSLNLTDPAQEDHQQLRLEMAVKF